MCLIISLLQRQHTILTILNRLN